MHIMTVMDEVVKLWIKGVFKKNFEISYMASSYQGVTNQEFTHQVNYNM